VTEAEAKPRKLEVTIGKKKQKRRKKKGMCGCENVRIKGASERGGPVTEGRREKEKRKKAGRT
jgi:hypothetical protein